jgi:hypothetical protein
MQEQNDLTETTPSSKKPNLFHDWWEEMYPKDFILTFKNYFFNHKQFFDEVFSEQWNNKVKPLGFLFTAVGVSLIIGSISPWGLKFSEEKPPAAAWYQIAENMDDEDLEVFTHAFELEEIMSIEDEEYRFAAIDNRLKETLNKEPTEDVTAEELQEYFKINQYDLLASRAEYVVLKNQVEHDKLQKEMEIGEVGQVIWLNIFVLWCMLYWLIAHRLFKRAERTSRETVFVFMYGLGMLIFFVYIPFIAIAGASEDHVATLGYGTLVVFVLFLLVLYRIFTIFKYTHNTGFFSLLMVYIKTFLVSALFGLPLLFIRKKKKG